MVGYLRRKVGIFFNSGSLFLPLRLSINIDHSGLLACVQFTSRCARPSFFAPLLVPPCSQTALLRTFCFAKFPTVAPVRPLSLRSSNAHSVSRCAPPLPCRHLLAISQAQYALRRACQVEFASQTSSISVPIFGILYSSLGCFFVIISDAFENILKFYILSSLINSVISVKQACIGTIPEISGHLNKVLSFSMLCRLAWILDKLGKTHLLYNTNYGNN